MAHKDASPNHSEQAPKIYNRILERAQHALADVEVKTWSRVREEIEKAAEFEADLADLTRSEVELLKAYVHRDMQELQHYLAGDGNEVSDWLKLDISLVEAKIRDLLLSMADKTLVEQVALDQRLHHGVGSYMAGEIACAGMLHCLNCGHMVCLVETTHIEPCHTCGNLYFKRVTSRWPREEEVDTPPAEESV